MTVRNYATWMFGMLKGGVCKTTSALFVAVALQQQGRRVLLIDADPGTQGVVDWCRRWRRDYGEGSIPFAVAQWTHSRGMFSTFVEERAGDGQYTHVLVDVGSEIPDVLRIGAIYSDQVIMPVSPEGAQVARIAPTWKIVAEEGQPGAGLVALTRVPSVGKGVAADLRRDLSDGGFTVAAAEVPRNLAVYAQFGQPITEVGAYAALADELRARDLVRRGA